MTTIDETDRRLLWEVDLDARASVTELGKRLGLSKQVISYRLQRLITNKFILGQIAVIDIHRLGLLTFRLYLRLTTSGAASIDGFLEWLRKHKHTLFVGTFSGSWDIEAVFTARNFIHFNEIFKELRVSHGDLIYRFDVSMTPAVHLYRRDYLLTKRVKYTPLTTYSGEPARTSWDDLDFKILEILSVDSHTSYDELGVRLGVAANTVKARINNLTAEGVIRGYRTVIDAALLGRRYMKALLKLAPLAPKEEKAFYAACAQPTCTLYLTEVLGNWQLEVEAEVAEQRELDTVIAKLRADFPGVILDFETLTMSREYKLNYLPSGKTTRDIVRAGVGE